MCTDDDVINAAGIESFEKLSPAFAQAHGLEAPQECEDVRCP
jgi:hypothetical protein